MMGKVETNAEISMYCKVSTNLGATYFQASNTTQALKIFVDLRDMLWNIMRMNCDSVDFNMGGIDLLRDICLEMQLNYDNAVNYILTISHSLANFKDREVMLSYLLRRTLLGTSAKKDVLSRVHFSDPAARLVYSDIDEGTGALLPFDSLINDVSLSHRLLVAQAASNALSVTLPADSRGSYGKFTDGNYNFQSGKLKIGFITCDFNDHPTAHLVEGIFSVVRRLRETTMGAARSQSHAGIFDIEIVAFSYGVSKLRLVVYGTRYVCGDVFIFYFSIGT